MCVMEGIKAECLCLVNSVPFLRRALLVLQADGQGMAARDGSAAAARHLSPSARVSLHLLR